MTIANNKRKIINHYEVVQHMQKILKPIRPKRFAKATGLGQATISQMKMGTGCQLQTFIRVAHKLGYEVKLEKKLNYNL